MTSDERLKSSPQPERPMGNVRRLVPRAQVRAPQTEGQSLDVAHLPQQRTDDDDDPGPSAA
jgi:hypothetical protein